MCCTQGTPGMSFGKQEAKTGWNAQPTCTVNLDAVSLPAEAMLGREGQGFSIAMNACEQPVCISPGCDSCRGPRFNRHMAWGR